MTEQEKIDGNKLIKQFESDNQNIWNNEYFNYAALNAGYDKDWNLLMDVVNKIIEIDITPAPNWSGYVVKIVPRGYVKISGFPMYTSIIKNVSIEGSLINAVYKAVVEFIKYYNENQK